MKMKAPHSRRLFLLFQKTAICLVHIFLKFKNPNTISKIFKAKICGALFAFCLIFSAFVFAEAVSLWQDFLDAYQNGVGDIEISDDIDPESTMIPAIGGTSRNNFMIYGGNAVELKSINSKSIENLGFIFTEGKTIKFRDLKFANFANTMTSGLEPNGGAMHITGSSLAFSGGITFSNNFAHGSGGAIYAYTDSHFYFNDSMTTFSNNIAENMGGGAISAFISSFSFTKSTISFIGNMMTEAGAEYGGGAIFAYESNFYFTHSSVSFIDNTVSKDGIESGGGAIYADATGVPFGRFYFSDSSVLFINNNAGYETADNDGGGAIYADDFDFSFVNSTVSFINNSAAGAYGGAIYAEFNSVFSYIGSNVSFVSNEGRIGGAIAANKSKFYFDKSSISFIRNMANFGNGGAISADSYSEFSFNGSEVSFTSNTSKGNGGGAISIDDNSKINFNGSRVSFTSNTAIVNEGGAIFADDKSEISFKDSDISFIKNTSLIHGGGAVAANNSNFHFDSSTVSFIENRVGSDGGAVYAAGSKFSFSNSSISFSLNMAAEGLGGAIKAVGKSVFSFDDSTLSIVDSNGSYGGGTIYASDSEFSFRKTEIAFLKDMASRGAGGAIYADKSKFYFEGVNAEFADNMAGMSGAAIFSTNTAKISFVNSNILFTRSLSVGGGNTGGSVLITNFSALYFAGSTIDFMSNKSDGSGGAISAEDNSEISFNDSRVLFTSNISQGNSGGGAIYIEDYSKISFKDSDISFTSNISQGNGGGGAIFGFFCSAFYFTNSNLSFVENIMRPNTDYSIGGGAIYAYDNTVFYFKDSDISFTSNTSLGLMGGGAVYFGGNSMLSFDNSTIFFTSNTADSGGALSSYSSILNFDRSHIYFLNNISNYGGGAIDSFTESILSFTNSEVFFKENIVKENSGGAISASDSKLSFVNSNVSFVGNTVLENGGAVYVQSNVNISFLGSNIDFISNTAGWGGAIYIGQKSTVSFTNSQIRFKDNISRNDMNSIGVLANAYDVLNDIYFGDQTSSLIFSGDNTLTNGIKTDGNREADFTISKGASLKFAGGDSYIVQAVNNNGKMVFSSGISTVAIINVSQGAILSLGQKANLTVGDLTLESGSSLSFDIDFEKELAATVISTGSVMIMPGANFNANILSHYLFTQVAPEPILFAQGADFSELVHKTKKYTLSVSTDGSTLYITNTPLPDFYALDLTKNEEKVLEIVVLNDDLAEQILELPMSDIKESLDSLSGVFLVNIIDALSYKEAVLPNSVYRLNVNDKFWTSANFNSTKFNNSQQALGEFQQTGGNVKAGIDLYGTPSAKTGVFFGLGTTFFNQAGNNASAFVAEAGFYGDAEVGGFDLNLEIGGKFADVNSRREVLLYDTFNPEAAFNVYGAGFAAGLAYMFSLDETQKAGFFTKLSWQLMANSEIKETKGYPVDLRIPTQNTQNSEGLFGVEFKHQSDTLNLIWNIFIGQSLVGRQTLNIEFDGEKMSIEGDKLDKMFYGGALGIGFNVSENVGLGAKIDIKINDNFNDYRGGISAIYKLPKTSSPE